MRLGISRYVGYWISESGHRLRIKRVSKDRASVDFFGSSGEPISRPYMGGAASVGMDARYDDYNGIFEVDLWKDRRRFILDLHYEYLYDLDPERRESLVPSLIRNEEDHFLDEYYPLYGPLKHFVRQTTQNNAFENGRAMKRRAVQR